MLQVIEKYFPEIPDRIRKLRLGWKLFAVALIVGVPALLTQARPLLRVVRVVLSAEVHAPVAFWLAMAGGCCMVGVLLRSLSDRRVARRRLVEFCKTWIAFSGNLTMLGCYADAGRFREGRGETRPGKYDDVLTDRVIEHWKHVERLRPLLFKLGETTVNPRPNHDWADIVAASPVASKRGYLTPFSFLLDLRNPVAAHLRDETVSRALQVASDYVDYLEYKHPFLEPALSGLRRRAADRERDWKTAKTELAARALVAASSADAANSVKGTLAGL